MAKKKKDNTVWKVECYGGKKAVVHNLDERYNMLDAFIIGKQMLKDYGGRLFINGVEHEFK